MVTPDGQGKEDLPAMRSGGYDEDLPCTLHAITRTPLEDGRCAWQWHKVENHCLRDNDGTLNSAEGRLLVTKGLRLQPASSRARHHYQQR